MISLSYINGTTDDLNSRSFSDIKELFESLDIFQNIVDSEIDMYIESTEIIALEKELSDKGEAVTKVNSNVFAKVGNAIIEACKKFKEFIDKIIASLNDKSIANKNDMDKLQILMKEYPDLKSKIILSYEEGELNIASAKTISELNNTYAELERLSRDSKIDPTTFRGRVDAAMKRFANFEKSDAAKGLTGVLTLSVLALSGAKYISGIRKDLSDIAKNADGGNGGGRTINVRMI